MPKGSKNSKQMIGQPDFTISKNKTQGDRTKDLLLAQYLLAKPETFDILIKLNNKLFELIQAQAIIQLLRNNGKRLSKNEILKIKEDPNIQLNINQILTSIIGEKRDEKKSIESGNTDEAGYFGMNPQAIRNVILKNGNFRERIYLLYREGYSAFSEKIFSDVEEVKKYNIVLNTLGANWQIEESIIEDIKTKAKSKTPYARGIYSAFTRDAQLRTPREEQEKMNWAQANNPKIDEDEKRFVPLSDREKLSKTGEFPTTALYDYKSKIVDPYISGSAIYKNSEKKHPYLVMNEKLNEPFVAGSSGITDTILTFALCTGATHEELIALRDAAAVSMIEDQSHSPHEVFFSAKSFGLPYTPGELYKDLEKSDNHNKANIKPPNHSKNKM